MSDRPTSREIQQGFRSAIDRIWKPQELGVLGFVLFIAGGLWLFVELADEVREGDIQSMDSRILLAMRNDADPADPIGPRWLEETGRDVTALGGVAVLTFLTLAIVAYLVLIQKPHLAVFVAATVGTGILASFIMKYSFSRPRPDLVPHGSYVYTSSFPSGHSMMSALTYLTLAALLLRVHATRGVRILLVSLAASLTAAIGISRVYLGVHWPSDVLAGWTAGAVWALVCGLVARLLQRHGHIEPPAETPSAESGAEAAE